MSVLRSLPASLRLVWLPFLAAAACGDATRQGAAPPAAPPSKVVLRPGDTLFDHLEALAVESFPATNLPPHVAPLVAQLVRGEGWTIAPGDWQGGEVEPAAQTYRRELGAHGPVRRYWIQPPADLDLGLGELWFRHEGRDLHRGVVPPGQRTILLWDREAKLVFGWETAGRRLSAHGERAPGSVEYGFRHDTAHELARWERQLFDPQVRPVTAADLADRLTLDEVERPCLAAPVPTRLSVHVSRFHGDALSLAVGVVDLGLAAGGERLRRAESKSDAAVFALEITDEGGRRQVWARWVTPGTGLVEETVDLAAYTGKSFRLRLITQPGAAGNAAFDYALWSGLRVLGTPQKAPTRPHVVLIDVDTLRADRLGCYGSTRPTTPRIDAWAARSATVYTDVLSANNWTLPSTVSLLTGLAPSQHGVLAYPQRISEAMEPLALRLSAAGYETRARTDGAFLGPDHGFSVGFEVFDYHRRPPEEHERIGWRPELEWLASRRSERPVFLFLHTYQVHEPYREDRRFQDPVHPYRGWLSKEPVTRDRLRRFREILGGDPRPIDSDYVSDLYDAGVRRMDEVVGSFLEGLDGVFGREPYLVVFTSDHGEELFEHGELGHGQSLHHEQLAVPLIIRYPEPGWVGRNDLPASGLDVLPTILDVLQLPRAPHLAGRPLRRAKPGDRMRLAEHMDTAFAVDWGGMRLLSGSLDGRSPLEEVYDRAADPGERKNLWRKRPDLVANFRTRHENWARKYPPQDVSDPATGTLPKELLEELRAMGYVGAAGR